ncbi:hypothetical protein CCQ62_23500 [Salmonella enterica]|nr:hypothetical protein [Salmonella enterica]
MNQRTEILSLRITPELKRKLEAAAKVKAVTVTEYVRLALSDTQGEKIVSRAALEVKALERNAESLQRQIEALTERQAALVAEIEISTDKVIKNLLTVNRGLWSNRIRAMFAIPLILLVLCVLGGYAGAFMR